MAFFKGKSLVKCRLPLNHYESLAYVVPINFAKLLYWYQV